MESINIAVIGANGVGKSHFVQRALSLSRTPNIQPSTARIQIDHVPFTVTLFELDLEYFDVDPERQIQWPRQVSGVMMPTIHGVLLLYDVMNRDSIIELPQTLSECPVATSQENGDKAHRKQPDRMNANLQPAALVNSSLPTVLVATKCDNPETLRQIDTEALAAACKSCIANFQTSASKPESARMALSTLLKALVLGGSK
jgi:GTPase SAR1 family protein